MGSIPVQSTAEAEDRNEEIKLQLFKCKLFTKLPLFISEHLGQMTKQKTELYPNEHGMNSHN